MAASLPAHFMLFPAVMLLVLAARSASPPPVVEVRLRNQALRLQPALGEGGARYPLNVLISADRSVLEATLLARGWIPREPSWTVPSAHLRVGAKLPELELEASGTEIDQRFHLCLWRSKQNILGLPLWLGLAAVERGVTPLPSQPPALESKMSAVNRVLADLSYGVSQTRSARLGGSSRGAGLPWVEVRFGPKDERELAGAWAAEGGPPAGPTRPPRMQALPAPVPRPPEVITRVPQAGKRVALTFDACSTLDRSRYDEQVIDTLLKHRVPATLFVSGRWAETHTRHMARLASQPLFEIANHSYVHPHLTQMPPDRQRLELLWTQQILYSLTGRVPRFFRPPYGEWDASITAQAAKLGLTTVQYDVPSGDPDPKRTAEQLTQWVVSRARPGSVIVMHMNRRGWHTAESLPGIIKGLRARGFVLSTVDQLVNAAQAANEGRAAATPPAPVSAGGPP